MSTRQHYGTLFPAAVVGSLPRPDFVREAVMGERPMDAKRLGQVMDAAVAYAVALQEEAGLDVITDGEWRRASYIGVIAELAHGFEVGRSTDGRPWTIVTGELVPKDEGFIAREIEFLKRVSSRKIKATLPAPALLGERMWDAEQSRGAYPTRNEFVEACVPILRRELVLLCEAGADIVQIDDPHLCLLVDDEVRAGYDDPEAEADFAVAMTNAVVEGAAGVRLGRAFVPPRGCPGPRRGMSHRRLRPDHLLSQSPEGTPSDYGIYQSGLRGCGGV